MPRAWHWAAAGLGGAAAAAVYATLIEPRWLQTTHHRIHIRRLPAELEGLRIALLTDMHAGDARSLRRVRAAVRLPLVLLGGVKSAAGVARAMDAGFELVGMARALLHDPSFPKKLQQGATSGCVPCNQCICEMDRGAVRCVRS
jgi:2,4-dienoyl-CoA reductase-like NADH-dependent reductase (Old Yellow Enzyme family)